MSAGPLERAARPRPPAIDVSQWLWLAACLAGVLTATATLPHFDQLHAALRTMVERQFPDEPAAMREEVAMIAMALLLGTGVVLVLAQTAFALLMHSGRGWARIVLVLLALLSITYAVSVFGGAPTETQVGLAVTVALMVSAVVLMFPPGAGQWFAQQSLARSGGYNYDD